MEFHKFEIESDDSGNEKKIKNKNRGQSSTNKSRKTPPGKKRSKTAKSKINIESTYVR